MTSFPDGYHPMLKTPLNQCSTAPWIKVSQHALGANGIADDDIEILLVRLDHFLNDHHDIVCRLRKHFLDRVISHSIKGKLGSSFTDADINLTHQLIQEYSNRYETDLRVIFDYFYDVDVRTVILHRTSLRYWRRYLDNTVGKRVIRYIFVEFCRRRAARKVIATLYPNQAVETSPLLPHPLIQQIPFKRICLLMSLTLVFVTWILAKFFSMCSLLLTILTMVFIPSTVGRV